MNEYLFWTLPVLLAALLGSIITRNHKEQERFNKAADVFRNRVLSELKGLYPVTQHWDMATFQRFSKSIIEIESAAEEFGFFVTRKAQFNTAIKEYCDYCKKITWDECADWSMYPTMRKQDEISPRERFNNIVKHLLSFTDEK